ncbi:hypothetical protein [Acholeplasma hippikon]|uniref:Uncharacterized protein n=1 Tax=Acholeplasma hippikon TaxID=264636 RepID=A0A449BL15_9MOLU|nr:hypothetical protein [Acholeplasma hippikon]VEU83165.1 Uncharacterised protein [Acholeplasma hippikon]
MKNFLKAKKDLILAISLIVIALLPTFITLFVKGRTLVDLGLLLTAILVIALILPIVNALKRNANKSK